MLVTGGCSSFKVKVHPKNIPYVALNLITKKLDDYADYGHFPRVKKPFLEIGPLKINTALRSRLEREMEKDAGITEEKINKPRRRRRYRSSFRGKLSPNTIYVELKFTW